MSAATIKASRLRRRKEVMRRWLKKQLSGPAFEAIAVHYTQENPASNAMRWFFYVLARLPLVDALENRDHPLLNDTIWNMIREAMRYSFEYFYAHCDNTWSNQPNSIWNTFITVSENSNGTLSYRAVTNADLPTSLASVSLRDVHEWLGIGGRKIPLLEIPDERYHAVREAARAYKDWIDKDADITTANKVILRKYFETLIGICWWSLEDGAYTFQTYRTSDLSNRTTRSGEAHKMWAIDLLEGWYADGWANMKDTMINYPVMTAVLDLRQFFSMMRSDMSADEYTIAFAQATWDAFRDKYYGMAIGDLNDPFSAPL